MIYQWKPGSRNPGKSQEVGDELERLLLAGGGLLHKEDVVAAARPEGSVLHKQFEWRDDVAARRFREQQAGDLITKIVAISEDQPEVERPAFVLVDEGAYRASAPISIVVQAPEETPMIAPPNPWRAIEELRAWRDRYEAEPSLAHVVASVTVILETAAIEAAA